MTPIKRDIPSFERNMCINALFGHTRNEDAKKTFLEEKEVGGHSMRIQHWDKPLYTEVPRTEETYLHKIEEFEKRCEKRLVEVFEKIDVKAIVKTDRYSLIHNGECEVTLNGESYMNGPFEFHRVMREIVRQVLNKNLYKLRFYMFINVQGGHMGFGKINYKFRYHYNTSQLS